MQEAQGGYVVTGAAIPVYQMLVMAARLRAEASGLKFGRRSTSAMVKQLWNLPKSMKPAAVLAEVERRLEEIRNDPEKAAAVADNIERI